MPVKKPASAIANGRPSLENEHVLRISREESVPIIPAPRIEFDIYHQPSAFARLQFTSGRGRTDIRDPSHQRALRPFPLGQEMIKPFCAVPSVCVPRWMVPCRGKAVEEKRFRVQGMFVVSIIRRTCGRG